MCSYSKITSTNLKLYIPSQHSLANGFIVSVMIENHILHNAAIFCTDFGAWSAGLRAFRLYFLDQWGDACDSSPAPSALPEYNKQYADRRKRHSKPSTIDVGDTVLVRQEKLNKLTTKFNQTPYTVINRKGSEVTARNRNNHIVRSNVSHFKKFKGRNSLTRTLTTTFKFNPDISTRETDNHMKMKMYNQHNSHVEQARTRRPTERYRFGNGIPSKFLSDFK